MSAWLVRQEGSPEAVIVPSADAVLEGLRDGNWSPADEVKGPGDAAWRAIEEHPAFAAAAEEVEPPPAAGGDETNLDMNPLIDVCLVLLIFFILTITYASLERAIAVPPQDPQEKGPSTQVNLKDIRDKVFVVTAKREVKADGGAVSDRVVVRVEKKEVAVKDLAGEMKQVINATGRKEMVLDADKEVPWGVVTAILDAAKGVGVTEVISNRRK